MHILYIHQYFATPKGTTGTRSYEFARRWIKEGHKVTLITGHYDIGGLELPKGLIQKQIVEEINVVVVGTKYSNKQSYLRRIASFLCFVFLSIYAGLRIKTVDAIYATSTPLTVGISAVVIKWAKRIPFVFEVRDQWPEVPIEMGIIKNKFMIKMLLWLEKAIYKNAAAIVALSPGIADGVKEVLVEDKQVNVIPNSCDTEMFRPDVDGDTVRKEHGWDDKLAFLYAGAMGKANSLNFIVDVAEKLKEHHDIHFVLIGNGSEKESIELRIKKAGLKNVEIINAVPKTELPRYFAASDVSMVIFANYPILEHNSANKFFDSLSAGKPSLLNYGGWQRKILEDNAAGFGCDLCNLNEFAEKVLYFNSHREELLEMGRNARRVAEKEFNRNKLAVEALSVLKAILN